MEADDHVFERRITALALARTLAPELTIRDTRAVTGDAKTIQASPSDAPLPKISVDLHKDEHGEPTPIRSPDLAIVATIGEGGMGRVHLARQRSLDRDVAVKTLKEGATPAAAIGLLREARLTGSLEHPGVIPVHALGIDERGGPLLVMKRVEGVDWATLIDDDAHPLWSTFAGKLDRLAAHLEILTQVCRTVEFAHSRNIIHRDIKPENVMVGSYGEVYLVDWGVATTKSAALGDGIAGTPAYMAPEMFLATTIDERTDVYLLGATLHELLTKRLRHEGADIVQVLQSALLSKPVTYEAHVPEQLAALCNQSTAREPADRPQTARAFREHIAEFLHQRSALALSDAAGERLARLHALLDGAGENAAPRDLAATYRLATEARFGFTESLREHATNAAATAGLRASVLALVELELRQGHADTAEALLREIDTPDPSLAARVAAVRERDEQHRRGVERLAAIEHDHDPTVSALPRMLLISAFVVACGASSVIAFRAGANMFSPGRVLVFGVGFLVATILGAAVFRKRLFANVYGTRLVAMMLGASALIVAQRVVAYVDNRPASETFAANLWMEAVGVFMGACGLQPRLAWAVPPLLVGAVLTPIIPEHAPSLFAGTTMVSFAIFALVLRPQRKSKA